MKAEEIKALISLLDDEDYLVYQHVEDKIISLGEEVIPFLENEWETNFNPDVQRRIEDLIHQLQFDLLKKRLVEWAEDGGQDLLQGMWLLSTYQYPDLEFGELTKALEEIYYEVWLEYKKDLEPAEQVRLVNNILFSKLRFTANTKNFHAPANSMLNIVLETKRGNPISLCVIYMLIARKLQMPVHGVNLPNLFVLLYETPDSGFYINVFNKGLIFSRSDIDNYIAHLDLKPLDIFYQPCSNLSIIKRVFRNLVVSFQKLGDEEKVAELNELLDSIDDGTES